MEKDDNSDHIISKEKLIDLKNDINNLAKKLDMLEKSMK